MSDQTELTLEEGSKPKLPEEQKDGQSSSDRSRIRRFIKIIQVILMCGLILWLLSFGWIMVALYLLVSIIVMAPSIANNAIKQKGYLLVNVFAITADPFFYYYPVLSNNGQSIHLDRTLGITVTVIRSFLDLLKLIYIIHALYRAYDKKDEKGERIGIPRLPKKFFLNLFKGKGRELLGNAAVHFWMLLLIDVPAIIPIPQVFVISGSRKFSKTRVMTWFLVQYLVRAIRTCFLFKRAIGDSGILADAIWAVVTFYLLLYMQGGHVFGALWYYYAIIKGTSRSKDDYGIYKNAIESGILEEWDFPKKVLHCFEWGLQNLCSFGQNLETSTDIWESIYAICMTNLGVLFFVFLIGKMQSDTTRSVKIKETWWQITQWPRFNDITDSVKEQIRKDKRKIWQNKRIKLDNLVSDLPESTAREVKLQFGLMLLKKVKEVEKWSEKSLKDLCDCMKPVLFVERTHIIRQGDPIDEIVFVLQGKIWTYTNASMNASELINEGQTLLKDGDICGEELIAWAAPHNEISSSSNPLPISTRTYHTYTNVEAFTILALDLKRVLLRRFERVVTLLQVRWRFIRIMRPKRVVAARRLC